VDVFSGTRCIFVVPVSLIICLCCWNQKVKFSRTWKVLQSGLGPGKSCKVTRRVLEKPVIMFCMNRVKCVCSVAKFCRFWIIRRWIREFDVVGMLSHQLLQHVIDGKKAIIQNPTEAQRLVRSAGYNIAEFLLSTKHAYWCSAPDVWNSLPKTVVKSDSVTVFKSRLRIFLFSRVSLFPFLSCMLPGPSAS